MAAKTHRVLPGFGLALGYTLVYLSLLILLPLGGLVLKASELGFMQIMDIALGERSLAAFRVTFGASLIAALINSFFWFDCGLGAGALSVSRQALCRCVG
jgi:sulfate transport system permease protein